MLAECEAIPTIPTRDLKRSVDFYKDTLGLSVIDEDENGGGVKFRCGSSGLYLYQTELAGTAQHTLCSFESDHVDDDIAELRAHGVRFETYDMEGVSWDGDVADMGGMHGVWFTDPDGNILALFERSQVPAGV
jgi:catechol 2,3-dioxygenase-like lactoylglutathione lyase family enzyme